jgi:D-tyrosyl-tRNA(Tyr) deacylase
MRALVQRVSSASVELVDTGEKVGGIGPGLLALVGVTHDDTVAQVSKLAEKLWNLRVFPDGAGDMNVSLAARSADGEDASVLVVSQFTLYGDTRKGRRPSFLAAARPVHAEPLIDDLVQRLRGLGADVATGRFRREMAVSLVNDGPVTLMLDV